MDAKILKSDLEFCGNIFFKQLSNFGLFSCKEHICEFAKEYCMDNEKAKWVEYCMNLLKNEQI